MSTFLGMPDRPDRPGAPAVPTAPRGVGHLRGGEPFKMAARRALGDSQLRRNLGKATAHIRTKRAAAVAELPDAQACCGFGGTFALKNADVSTAMLADKMRGVLATKAEICTAGDSSCLMHIGGGLSRLRTGVRTVHLAEILASTQPGRPAT